MLATVCFQMLTPVAVSVGKAIVKRTPLLAAVSRTAISILHGPGDLLALLLAAVDSALLGLWIIDVHCNNRLLQSLIDRRQETIVI